MSDKDTGGPAFPLQPASTPEMHYLGMTKREWYVGQALAGIMANEGICNRQNSKDIGRMAVLVADAVMGALK